MIKKVLSIAMLGAVIFSSSCKHDTEFQKLKGLEYKIVKDAHGRKTKIGEIYEYNLIAVVDTMAGKPLDTLANTWKQGMGHPSMQKLDSMAVARGEWPAVFQFMGAGDSAVIYINMDTIIKNAPQGAKLPPFFKPGGKIMLYVSEGAIKSEEDYRKEMAARQEQMMKEMQDKMEAQKPIDEKALQDYFAQKNLKPAKTESGMYYTIDKPGAGPTPKAGQMVSMKYIGKTLDGTQFDANMDESGNLLDKREALTFPIGQGHVIKGWDEGVMLLKKGSKATLYIPSALGYGPRAMGPNLPANSILVFTVEVVDIKDAPPAPAGGPAGPGGPGGPGAVRMQAQGQPQGGAQAQQPQGK